MRVVAAVGIAHEQHTGGHARVGESRGVMRSRARERHRCQSKSGGGISEIAQQPRIGRRDLGARPLAEIEPHAAPRFDRAHLKGLAPAGRLDIDSTGLLVLTQDGRIAKQLIGQDSEIEKTYLVRVEGKLSDAGLQSLNHGLSLDGEALKPAKVTWQNEDQLRFVLKEGKKRQIRRMCELVGLIAVGLKRVSIGNVMLGDLPVGQWRYLRADERF